jgi:hypothetical protein
MRATYDPATGTYHYSYWSSEANARISFNVDAQGNYVGDRLDAGRIHMVDQSPGGKVFK